MHAFSIPSRLYLLLLFYYGVCTNLLRKYTEYELIATHRVTQGVTSRCHRSMHGEPVIYIQNIRSTKSFAYSNRAAGLLSRKFSQNQ